MVRATECTVACPQRARIWRKQRCRRASSMATNAASQKKTDCKLGAWGAWGACTQSCEGGIAKRQRKVETEPSRTGTACVGPLIENKPCNEMTACSQKVDCQFSAWNEWSMCTKCSGQKFCTRTTSQLAFGV